MIKKLTLSMALLSLFCYANAQQIRSHERWRLSLSAGYGYRPAKLSSAIPSDFSSYAKKLKSGWILDGSAYYFINRFLGVGLQANRFATSNSLDNVYRTYEDGHTEYGTMNDNISITFIGPGAVFRKASSNGNTFLAGMSVGYIGYLNRFKFNGTDRLTGGNAGYAMHAGYDLHVSKYFSVGAKFSAVGGVITKFQSNGEDIEIEEDSGENLSHVDISVGVRFHPGRK